MDAYANTYKTCTRIIRCKQEGHQAKAMELVAGAIESDWISFAQVLTQMELSVPELNGILDQALEYFIEIEDYKKCKWIMKCREFLEFRRADGEEE